MSDNSEHVQAVTNDDDVLLIKAASKSNGMTTMAIGIAGAVLSLVLLGLLPATLKLSVIFILSASIVAMLIGWFKIREPQHSVVLTRKRVEYHHRKGAWFLDWDNIVRIDSPRIQRGLDLDELELVGIRLNDYGPLLESITPRLATNLLMEQRPLLLHHDSCNTGSCYSASLIENDQFKLPDGKVITGIKAMFANRMVNLRNQLGYDLFIATTELDRSKEEFIELLRQCQNQVRLSQQGH